MKAKVIGWVKVKVKKKKPFTMKDTWDVFDKLIDHCGRLIYKLDPFIYLNGQYRPDMRPSAKLMFDGLNQTFQYLCSLRNEVGVLVRKEDAQASETTPPPEKE